MKDKATIIILKYIGYFKKYKLPTEAIPFWIASVITGLVAVVYEFLFSFFESLGIKLFNSYPFSVFLVSPLFFSFAWYITQTQAPNARGSGIPQLMVAIDLSNSRKSSRIKYLLNFKIIIVKIASSLLLLIGGGVTGREGPTLQIAGSIYKIIYDWSKPYVSNLNQRVMLITGGASGLAAAFNTPLGGIVYVIEELTRSHITHFRTAIFTSVIIAGMTAQFFLGSYLYLGSPKVTSIPLSSIGTIIVVSIICGFGGAIFSLLLCKIIALKKHLKSLWMSFLVVFSTGLLFALLVYITGVNSMGSGKPVINNILFKGVGSVPWFTFVGRFFGSIFTFSTGSGAGIFAPALSSGAALGALIAELFNIPIEYHTIIVMCGMIGFLTGVTHSPFTSAILVLEMTDRHSAIFYFLLAGLVANLIAKSINKNSFYELQKKNFI